MKQKNEKRSCFHKKQLLFCLKRQLKQEMGLAIMGAEAGERLRKKKDHYKQSERMVTK